MEHTSAPGALERELQVNNTVITDFIQNYFIKSKLI